MPINPAFHRFAAEATIVGRLLAAFGELEVETSNIASKLIQHVAKAHAFVDTPPHGVETLTRDNGDKLLYDAKANVFAVVSREGAPRTMFKPRDGAAYWAEQKQRVSDDASSADGGRESRYGAGRYDERSRDRRSGGDPDDQG